MTRVFLRNVYRLILRVHPVSFQDRFGGEMLWIFDEECQRGGAIRLFFDGVRSLVRQRCRFERESVQPPTGFGVLIATSEVGPVRLLQAGVLAFGLVTGFMMLLGMRCPLPFSIRWPECMPRGTLSLQAQSHIKADSSAVKR